ncbi:hypothetical protein [Ramlibacter alkalitolerans]|uniref:Uncharacterized protein n=1 Tax=Ramlibacter alkalitolerans TaxID=2039631 RepID=A0ABS1JLR0_9BURK|nr:hypothetical protein [Ramlibacter alkalitolerans]MBL0425168.1 hypothetical protein [Ramlibacter alkalitolerans]
MGQDDSIAALRSRMSALVEQEGVLLTQAFDLSRAGGDRRGVDALFARVTAIQVERNGLKKQIGNILGTHRLHSVAEVWRLGVYDYRPEVGAASVRVRVASGPLGLQVFMPGRGDPVRIESLEGTFEGPLAVDDAATHQAGGDAPKDAAGNGAETRARGRTTTPKRAAAKKRSS